MKKFNIRLYKSEDCKEIVMLFYNTVHTINAKDYNREQLEVWAPRNIDISKWNKSLLEHYSIVVEEENTIIGFGDLAYNRYFDRLYVHKDYQGVGIANLIVDQIEKYAKENKIKIIETHASITAKGFFEKNGYKVLKEQVVERNGKCLINFVMEKILIP